MKVTEIRPNLLDETKETKVTEVRDHWRRGRAASQHISQGKTSHARQRKHALKSNETLAHQRRIGHAPTGLALQKRQQRDGGRDACRRQSGLDLLVGDLLGRAHLLSSVGQTGGREVFAPIDVPHLARVETADEVRGGRKAQQGAVLSRRRWARDSLPPACRRSASRRLRS